MFDDDVGRLNSGGFLASAAIADTPGAAWAFARYGKHRVVAPGEHKAALLDMLRKLGLRTVGCIAGLPRAPLAARFGSTLLRRLDQALGREEEAISPRLPVPELTAERVFAKPIVLTDDIERTAAQLAANLRKGLDERQLGARELELKLFRVDGHVVSIRVRSASPVYTAPRITMLFRERIAGFHKDLDAGFGFDLIRLNILTSEERPAEQADFAANGGRGKAYGNLVDKLGARLGTDRVQHFVAADTHIPERSFGLLPEAAGSARPEPDLLWQADDVASPVRSCTRPLLLFERPERVEAVAEVPDGPPIRFRWRRALYRIACEWWRDGRGGLSRDYFRVEDDQGYRFWIFRQGLFERETRHPVWFMHGMFA